MRCEKCDGKIVGGCCTKCGALQNGNQIKEVEIDKNEDLKLYNKDFDIVNQNKNLFLIFIFGPLYFSYRGYFLLGTILGIVDYLLLYYMMNNVLGIIIFIFGPAIVFILYMLINRLFYVIFSNYICLLIDKYKVKKIKEKYTKNYKSILKKHKHNKYYFILTLVVYFVLIALFVIVKGIKNGLL